MYIVDDAEEYFPNARSFVPITRWFTIPTAYLWRSLNIERKHAFGYLLNLVSFYCLYFFDTSSYAHKMCISILLIREFLSTVFSFSGRNSDDSKSTDVIYRTGLNLSIELSISSIFSAQFFRFQEGSPLKFFLQTVSQRKLD